MSINLPTWLIKSTYIQIIVIMIVQQKNRIVPPLGSKVTYEDPDRIEWRKAMILSRAGKSSGANKYWFNIKSVDFENINGRKILMKKF